MNEIDTNDMFSLESNFKRFSNVKSNLIIGCKTNIRPKFSIVIPTYSRINTLSQAINSALNQVKFDNYNIVISDDNPERNTPIEQYVSSLKDKRIKYYKNEKNLGLFGNFNRCIELCDGDYLVFLHDDDILLDTYLYDCNRILEIKPDIEVLEVGLYSWKEYLGEKIPSELNISTKYHLWKIPKYCDLFYRQFMPTGVMMKKESVIKIGGFSFNYGPSADLSFAFKANLYLNVYKYDKILFIYRWAFNESMKYKTRENFFYMGIRICKCVMKRYCFPKIIKKSVLSSFICLVYDGLKRDFPKESKAIDINSYHLINNSYILTINKYLFFSIAHLFKAKRLLSHKY